MAIKGLFDDEAFWKAPATGRERAARTESAINVAWCNFKHAPHNPAYRDAMLEHIYNWTRVIAEKKVRHSDAALERAQMIVIAASGPQPSERDIVVDEMAKRHGMEDIFARVMEEFEDDITQPVHAAMYDVAAAFLEKPHKVKGKFKYYMTPFIHAAGNNAFEKILNENEKYKALSAHDIVEEIFNPEPIDCTESNEFLDVIERALKSLPPREAKILNLYFFEGNTLEEIGDVIGVTGGRVQQLKEKALSRLRFTTNPAVPALESYVGFDFQYMPLLL